MEQLSQSGSRGRRRTGNEPAPHKRVKGERRANEPRRTASPHRASANNAGRAHTPAAEQTPARPKSRYIPALDGLRTLAVVAVVLYHLNLTWAQGGLLGVTIFFVLSGYLITRLLLNEVAKTGRIDLKSFWIRRIRRLVPAVVTVVFVTCALCTIFNHVMLTKMRPDILPSLLFFNNWWQIAQNVSYFNALGDPSPLTHFWSLAIEEQFYLIWPPLLFAMVSMHVSKPNTRRVVLGLAAVSALAMMVLYNPAADPSRVYYGTDTRVFSLLLGLGLVLVVALRDFLKKICLAFCGLFNDTLKLDGMMFFWSLINTFKDLGRVKIGRLVVNTLLMWAAYLGSYTALAAALTVAGEPMQLVDVFGLLFGRNAADFAALLPGGALGTAAPAARWLLLAWFVLPLLAMWAATLLPEGVRGAMNQATQAAPAGESYLNLLPQADEHDRAVFLSRYFGLENKDYVKRFLQMNRGITILEDYSAGSNATTMLCMDTQSTFYRKYAFGKDGAKLAEQLDWLRAQQDRLPLCDILRSEEADGCCWYDMVYNPQAVGMFRYLHSNPVEKSRAILRAVLATLEDKLYKPTAVPADAEKIEKYIETKVDGNLKKLHEDRMLRELMSYDTLRINGVEYKNLPALDWMFDHDRLRNLFAKDPVGTIHGDLTIENIICRTDNDSWYLIDPNTGNLHESPFLDYGKLLQSLHGSYEFMMKTPRVAVQDNRIDFQLTRSAAYDALLAAVMEDLSARYPREQVESILMHEVIHWLRLMPYKLNKDRKRAAMFYAGLVMVANDVADFSEHKKETLC